MFTIGYLNTISQLREPEIIREMAPPISGAGNGRDELGYLVIPESKDAIKQTRESNGSGPCYLCRNNLSNEKSNHGNGVKYIKCAKTHEFKYLTILWRMLENQLIIWKTDKQRGRTKHLVSLSCMHVPRGSQEQTREGLIDTSISLTQPAEE